MKGTIRSRGLSRAVPLLAALTVVPQSASADDLETAGDLVQLLLPGSAYLLTHMYDDPGGRWQFLRSFATVQAMVHTMKPVISKTRPNGGDRSFPSGHTAAAFQGAAFIQRRYGWGWGVPAYALASFVGATRIEGVKHDWQDVLSGATIGIFGTYLFTDPLEVGDTKVRLEPLFGTEVFGVNFVLGAWEERNLPDGEAPPRTNKNIQHATGSDPTRVLDRIDLSTNWLDAVDGDAFALQLGGALAVGSNEVGIELGYVNSDIVNFEGLGFGDILLTYKNTPYVDTEASWWQPRAISLGIDTLLPSGKFEEGTGAGAWVIAPKAVLAWTPVEGFTVYPGIRYFASLWEDSLAPDVNFLSLPVRLEYKFQNGVYAFWEIDVVHDFESDETVGDHRLELGVPLTEQMTLFTRWTFVGRPRGTFDPSAGIIRFYDTALTMGLRYIF